MLRPIQVGQATTTPAQAPTWPGYQRIDTGVASPTVALMVAAPITGVAVTKLAGGSWLWAIVAGIAVEAAVVVAGRLQ